MRQDEVLYKIADKVKSFAVIYVCDIDQVPDFSQMYGTFRADEMERRVDRLG